MGVAENFRAVEERINNSAFKAKRDSDNIKLIAVSKTIGLERIITAVKSGVSILGENRVQEAEYKIKELGELHKGLHIEWHLIGHLQKNKAKTAVRIFDVIHSLDTLKLAVELDRQAQNIKKTQRALVQVKLADEDTKYGVSEDRLMELLKGTDGMKNLKIEGLMIMPPFFEDPEEARPYFRRLRHLAEKASGKGFMLRELSMGMSHDFETAIEEGSTMVRVGTAIFGEREVHCSR